MPCPPRPAPTSRRSAWSDPFRRVLQCGLLLGLVGLAACGKTEAPPEAVRAVRILTVAADDGQMRMEFAAEVRARTESRLGFRVGGKIVARPAELGASVKPGQVLASLDPQDLQLGSQAAQAGLSAAIANQAQAQADFVRFKELRDQGFISSAELERRETALKSANAALAQARAQARTQGNQASYATLVADAPGVITAIEAEPGQVVSSGTPVLRLAHDGPRDVVFSVPEDKAQIVRAIQAQGGKVMVRMWGEATDLPASLREIAASADTATRTYLVKADVGQAPVKLGQTATVTIQAGPEGAGATIRVPVTALFEREGKSHVWRLDPASMSVQPVAVAVVGADERSVILGAGIAPGQKIVTAGVHVLLPGQKVKIFEDTAVAAPQAPASTPR